MDDIIQSLTELGLTSKEIGVYLAMLELGPASVQDIAKKSGVNRTTTYVMIEALRRRGLLSTLERGKKTLFVAENPSRLSVIVGEELNNVKAKNERFQTILPRLLAIFNAAEEKPKVRFFDGEEALDLVRQEISEVEHDIWEMYAVDESSLVMANIHGEKRIERTRHMTGRLLMAIKSGFEPAYFDPNGVEVRTFSYERYPFSGSFVISGDRLYVIAARGRAMGFIVESKEMCGLFRAWYETAWANSAPWQPPSAWFEKAANLQK